MQSCYGKISNTIISIHSKPGSHNPENEFPAAINPSSGRAVVMPYWYINGTRLRSRRVPCGGSTHNVKVRWSDSRGGQMLGGSKEVMLARCPYSKTGEYDSRRIIQAVLVFPCRFPAV